MEKKRLLFDNQALVALIIPLIIEQLLAVLVGMADSIMIASVGEAAVSGVSLVDNVMVLFIMLFSALATGGAVIAGQYMGQRKDYRACEASRQMVWFVGITSLIIMLAVYLLKGFILHVVFGKIEPDVMAHANIYLLIVTASVPFIALYNAGAAVFRTMGNSKISMQVSILMNLINVAGNAICIYGLHMGAEGVAIPTLLSRMTAAVVILVLLKNPKLRLNLSGGFHYQPDWIMIKRILGIGIPNSLENAMFQLGKILVLSLVSSFGTYAIAANAVCNAVAMFEILPGLAMGLAITTVISRCVGAGDYEQVRYYTRKLLMITYVGIWIVNGMIIAALPLILKAYQLTDVTAELAKQLMYLHTVFCVLIWPLSFSLPNVLRAAGDARTTMMISLVSMWVCRVILSFVLGKYMGLGVFGVWVAMIMDWCVRSIWFIIRYKRGKWKLIRSI